MNKALSIFSLFISFLSADSFLVDTSVTCSPAHSYQWMCDVIFDGTNFFTVWSDERHSYPFYTDPNMSGDIFGARLDGSGTLIDTGGIAISVVQNPQLYPKVCCGDSLYLVTWCDQRNGAAQFDVYGARVMFDGTVIDTSGIEISAHPGYITGPSTAFDGTNFLVVWSDERNGNMDIFGARITPGGVVLDPAGIQITSHSAHNMRPSVSFNGNIYLVTYDDQRNGGLNSDIYATRITTDGVVLDTSGFQITDDPSEQWMSEIIFGGGYFFVVWMDERSPSGIYGARIIADTVLLDPNGIVIATSPAVTRWAPQAAFDGENFLVVYSDGRGGFLTFDEIYGTRVTTDGTVLDPTGFAISIAPKFQEFPSVAYGNGLYLVAWEDRRSEVYHMGGPKVYGTCVTPDTIVLNPEGNVVSLVPNPQMSSAAAFDGENFLVVWHDERADHDIYGIRITSDGQIVDSISFPVTTEIDAQFEPAVAYGDSFYLCVWQDYYDTFMGLTHIHGIRISKEGVLLDTAIIHIRGDSTARKQYPDVAFGINNFLVVSGVNVGAVRIDQNGVVLDTNEIFIDSGSWARVTFDDPYYFVVWHRSSSWLGAVRIDTAGTVVDTSFIPLAPNSGWHPSVAAGITNNLVVWEDERNGDCDIYGARISSDGVLLDTTGIAIAVAPGDQLAPDVAFDGTDYVVAWAENAGYWYDIYGARIDTAGNIIEYFTVCTQPFLQIEPCVTRGSGDTVLITYTGWVDSIDSHPGNTMRIWGSFYSFTDIAEEPGEWRYSVRNRIQISPNPFAKTTTISLSQVQNTECRVLKIYDISGRLVRSLSLPTAYSLLPTITWDGRDDKNKELPGGVYFVHVEIQHSILVEQVILLR